VYPLGEKKKKEKKKRKDLCAKKKKKKKIKPEITVKRGYYTGAT
jgi:hypothetical protein